MNVVELFASIGLKADTQKAEKFLGTTKGIKIALTAATAGSAMLSAGFAKLSADAQRAALEFKKFEADTGSSAQTLQRWSAVAEQVSGSGQAVADSIRAISLNQEQIKIGQGNISGYQLLGIDPRTDPFEVIEQIRTKTEGLSQSMKRQVMSQFGVSRDLMTTLELTNEEFEKMARRSFIIAPETLQTIDRARMASVGLTQGLKYIRAQITASLSPAIEEMANAASEFIRINQDGIVKVAKQLFTWITRFAQAIGRAAIMIDKIVRGTIGWEVALKGVLIMVGVLNAAFLTSPLGLFIAGMVLLVAVLDDLYVYTSGTGKSMFGLLFEKFPKLAETFNNSISNVVKMFTSLKDAIDALKMDDIPGMQTALREWGLLGDIIGAIAAGLLIIKGIGSDAIKVAQGEIGAGEAAKKTGGRWFEALSNFSLSQMDDPLGILGAAGAATPIPGMGAMGSFLSAIGKVAAEKTGAAKLANVTINVNGARDPEATATAVQSKIDSYIKEAETQRARPNQGR